MLTLLFRFICMPHIIYDARIFNFPKYVNRISSRVCALLPASAESFILMTFFRIHCVGSFVVSASVIFCDELCHSVQTLQIGFLEHFIGSFLPLLSELLLLSEKSLCFVYMFWCLHSISMFSCCLILICYTTGYLYTTFPVNEDIRDKKGVDWKFTSL